MNVVWMALIAVALPLERTVTWGEQLSRAIGLLAGAAGITVLVIQMV